MKYRDAIKSIEPVIIWLVNNGHIHLNDTTHEYTQRISNISQLQQSGYKSTLRDISIEGRIFNEIHYRVHALPMTATNTWVLEGFIRIYEKFDDKRWCYYDGWLYANCQSEDSYQISNGIWVQLYRKGVFTKYPPRGWIGSPSNGCWKEPV